MEPTIGDHLVRLRTDSTLTQEQLADRAGVSVETVKKLEQNARTSARIPTLRKLATALGVPTSALMGSAAQAQAMREPDAEPLGLVGIRRVLTPARTIDGRPVAPAPPVTDTTLARVRRLVADTNRVYHANDYTAAINTMPAVLTATDALIDAAGAGDDGPAALSTASYAYQLAGRLLIQLRQLDLAHIALDRAADHARTAGDQTAAATTTAHLCWLLLRTGRITDVEVLAARTADTVEPRLSTATARDLAAWGVLLIKGAAAAARNAREDDARSMLTLAAAGAEQLGDRLGRSGDPADRWFGAVAGNDFSAGGVALMRVETAVIAGEPGRALELARAVAANPQVTPSSRQRHRLDVAWAYEQTGRTADATRVLMQLRDTAPAWLRQQRYAREIVQTIKDGRRRALTAELAQLSALLGDQA
ncbi:helix-turn-helix domain-containing protein [Micromonospora endolithica]|uniref:Helix-turn-helix domain-containing protein n=1 Tax=Micromonospora endolithica TaxID=230091 RepID=A0A3A9YSF7_9ACTN|nr:helix-turn-helix transcriptional regulator [Micromonospora endolithica]RKN38434.1 helix-turn-helix domain-containing protein [Micromonospora endolithica]TWJ23148.1 transcriptional regulator with XRE-family HTH domain [Micromonospora endolithica]